MRYVTVVTDAELEPDQPLEADCGECLACVRACPASAIRSERSEFDLSLCKAALDEFRKLPYISQHICVKACSPESARRARESREEEGGADSPS